MKDVVLHNKSLSLINENLDFNEGVDISKNLNSDNSILNKVSSEQNNNFNKSKKFNKGNRLFLKILVFQFIVSGFVFFILFLLKKTLPIKFNAIATQLNTALNEGPKFYDSINSAFNNVKNFSLSDQLNNLKQKNNLNKEKKEETEVAKKKNELENAYNLKINKVNGYYNNNKLNSLVNDDKVVIDDLENMSVDDGDVLFANFVPPIVNCGGKVSSKFGARINPITKKLGDFHKGVDVVARVGTPIVAIDDGVVKSAAFSKKSGNFIVISHPNGYESRFAHCNKLLKKVGDKVKKNEVIAHVGQSGDVTGAHMHFGFRKDGNWFDPKVVFPVYG